MTQLLLKCSEHVTSNQSSLTQWHELLGWFSQPFDKYLIDSMSSVRIQLQLLWSSPMLKIMFQPLNGTLEVTIIILKCRWKRLTFFDRRVWVLEERMGPRLPRKRQRSFRLLSKFQHIITLIGNLASFNLGVKTF